MAAEIGNLETTRLGARGLSSGLLSPCERARTIAGFGVPAADVAVVVFESSTPDLEPSAVAKICGIEFEGMLTSQDASRIRALYIDAGVMEEPIAVRDIDPERDQDESVRVGKAAQETHEELVSVVAGVHGSQGLILQPTFPLEIGRVIHHIRPDGMRWINGRFRVVEIKTYLDRDGFTDPHAVTSAVQQSAFGVVAARAAFAAWGFDPGLIDSEVDLIFRSHGKEISRLRSLSAEGDVVAVLAAIDAVGVLMGTDIRLDDRAQVRAVPHRYRPSCDTSCGMANVCRDEADKKGHSGVHGTSGVEVLDAAGMLIPEASRIASGEISDTGIPVAKFLQSGWNVSVPVPSPKVKS